MSEPYPMVERPRVIVLRLSKPKDKEKPWIQLFTDTYIGGKYMTEPPHVQNVFKGYPPAELLFVPDAAGYVPARITINGVVYGGDPVRDKIAALRSKWPQVLREV